MAPPVKGSASSDATPPTDVSAVAVRSDHWAAITSFINEQSIVLDAAVPSHLNGLQKEARQKFKALSPILEKYKFPANLAEVTVPLGNGEQQKVRISQDAFNATLEVVGGSKNDDTVKKPTEVTSVVANANTAGQPKAQTKSTEASQAFGEMKVSSNTTTSSGTRPSQPSDVRKPVIKKRPASVSQATAHASEEASRRAASKLKQRQAQVSSADKPRVSTTTPVKESDLRRTLEKSTETPVVQPKKTNPIGRTQAHEPKRVTGKTLKDSNAPKRDGDVNSKPPHFRFISNGSRSEQKTTVRPDMPPQPLKTYSKAAGSSDRSASPLPAKIDVGPNAILKDKTNKSKAPSAGEKTTAKTDSPWQWQMTKPVIKKRIVTADGKVIPVKPKPVTAKRPRPTEDAHVDSRPSKKPATKQTTVLDADVSHDLGTEADACTRSVSSSSVTEAEGSCAQSSSSGVIGKVSADRTREASPVPVASNDVSDTQGKEAVSSLDSSKTTAEDSSRPATCAEADKAAPVGTVEVSNEQCKTSSDITNDTDKGSKVGAFTASEPTIAATKELSPPPKSKVSKATRGLPQSTIDSPQASQRQKGIAYVVKKASKRPRDLADEIIDDGSDEEGSQSRRPTKKANRSPAKHGRRSSGACDTEEDGGESDDVSPQSRTTKESSTTSAKDTKPESPAESDEKYQADISLAEQNFQAGLVMDGPRRRPSILSAPPTPSTPSLSSPRTISPTASAPKVLAGTKRRSSGASDDYLAPKKQKVQQDPVVPPAPARRRPSSHSHSAEDKAKKLIEERTGKPAIDYSTMKWAPKSAPR